MTIPSDRLTTSWVLDADGVLKPLDDVYKAFRKQEAQEKKLEYVHQQLAGATASLSTQITKYAESNILAFAKGQLLAQGISALVGEIKNAWENLDAYRAAIKNFTGDLTALQKATDYGVTAFELMQSQLRLQTMDIKLSNEQITNLYTNIDKLSEAYGKDFLNAITIAENALTGQTKALKQLGVTVIEDTEAEVAYALTIGTTVKNMTEEEKAAYQVEKALKAINAAATKIADESMGPQKKVQRAWVEVKDNLAIAVDYAENLIGRFETWSDRARANAWWNDPNWREWLKADVAKNIAAQEEAQRILNDAIKEEIDLLEKSVRLKWEGAEAVGFFEQMKGAFPTFKGRGVKRKRKKERFEFEFGKGTSIGGMEDTPPGELEAYEAQYVVGFIKDLFRKYAPKFFLFKEEPYKEAAWQYEQIKLQEKRKQAILDIVDANWKLVASQIEANAKLQESTDYIKTTAINSLTEFGGSIWDAANAFIEGSDTFIGALGKIFKATMMSIAKEATIKALMALAEAAMHWYAAGPYLIAAAKYSAVAIAAGAAGLGIPSSIESPEHKERKHRREKEIYRPDIGEKIGTNQPININVYIGDPDNPSAALLMTRQLEARLGGKNKLSREAA